MDWRHFLHLNDEPIKAAPPVLTLVLKRFCVVEATGRRYKMTNDVRFPLEGLDLSSFLAPQGEGEKSTDPARIAPLYNLSAVVNHLGGLSGGHCEYFSEKLFLGNEWLLTLKFPFHESNQQPTTRQRIKTRPLYAAPRTRRCGSPATTALCSGWKIRKALSSLALPTCSSTREPTVRDCNKHIIFNIIFFFNSSFFPFMLLRIHPSIVPHLTGKAASAFLRSRFPRVHKKRVDTEAVRANVWRPAGADQGSYNSSIGSMRQIASRISGHDNAEARPVACVDMCQIRRCPEKNPECCDCRTNYWCCDCWRRYCCQVCNCYCYYCVIDWWAVYQNLANAFIWVGLHLLSFVQFLWAIVYFTLSMPCRCSEYCLRGFSIDMMCLFCPQDPPRIEECCSACLSSCAACASNCASDVVFLMGDSWSGPESGVSMNVNVRSKGAGAQAEAQQQSSSQLSLSPPNAPAAF